MSKKTKVLASLALVAAVVATVAYLKAPVSAPSSTINDGKQAQKSQNRVTAADVEKAATPAAAVDAAVSAIVQGYDQDQTITGKDDADSAYVEQRAATINSLSEVYNETDF